MRPCPACKGKRFLLVTCCGPSGCDILRLPCPFCEGVGEVTEEHMRRMEAGERLRDDRLARNLSQREEARRLGISVVELLQREFGR